MRSDAVTPAVVDGSDVNRVLEVPVDPFNLVELLVAHGYILSAHVLVAGADQVLPIELRFSGDFGLVDDELAVLLLPQVPAEHLVRHEVTDCFGVGFTVQVTQGSYTTFGLCDDLRPLGLIPHGLLGVMNHYEPAAGDTALVADDLLHPEAVTEFLVPAWPGECFRQGSVFTEPHAFTDDERITGTLQGAPVLLAVETSVHDHDDPAELPVIQVPLDLIHHAHVNSVARPHPAADWDAVAGHCETKYSLSQVGPAVLAVTTLPQGGT